MIRLLIVPEAHENLVQHDVVDDFEPIDLVELLGEPAGQRAAAIHEIGDA